jgi:hypothetical protein
MASKMQLEINRKAIMKKYASLKTRVQDISGRAPLFLLWLLGVPLPVLFVIYLFQH